MQSKVAKIQRQIDALEKQKSALASKEKAQVIKDINYKIGLYGITPDEISFSMSSRYKQHLRGPVKVTKPRSSNHPLAGVPIPPKYALGDKTWTGRGRQPLWVTDHLSKGGKLEDLLIDKPVTEKPKPARVVEVAAHTPKSDKPAKPKSKARETAETLFDPKPSLDSSTSAEKTQH